MLTQGPTPDLKCKLIISLFLTLPHLLDSHFYQECHIHCIVTTNNEDGIGGGWLIYIRVWVGGQEVGIIL